MAVLQAKFSMDVFENGPVEGFCGFFDVQFRGSEQNPADHDILLSTAPDPTGSTHWGQQSFVLHPPIACMAGDTPHCR
jgi:protein arginine N-methyltransferase 1